MRTNFENIETKKQSSEDYKVGFFSIKDKETALVRFNISTEEDFNIYTLHPNVALGDGKKVKIDCIRDIRQPLASCPLCASGNYDLTQSAFIELLQFKQAADGTIVAEPKVWERSAMSTVVTTLKGFLNMYKRPLTTMICAVTRTGSGFNDTKYQVTPMVAESADYPSDFSDFDDFDLVKFNIVRSWNYDDMTNFISTGEIPKKKQENDTTPKVVATPVTPVPDVTIPFGSGNTELPFPLDTPTPQPTPSTRPARVYNN